MLLKINRATYIDLDSISFLTIEKTQQMSGPPLLHMVLVVDGHRVVINNEETQTLMAELKKRGMIEELA